MKKVSSEKVRQAILEYNKRVKAYMENDNFNEKEVRELDALWDSIHPPLKKLKDIKTL